MPETRKGLRLHLDAEIDLQTSVSFYRERGGEELAARFKMEVATAFTAIASTPECFAFLQELDKEVICAIPSFECQDTCNSSSSSSITSCSNQLIFPGSWFSPLDFVTRKLAATA